MKFCAGIVKYFKNMFRPAYYSCEYIQHGINFDYDGVKMCCFNCHEGGGRQFLIKDYNGENIDWNAFFEEKRKFREANKNGVMLERCKGCFFLKKRRWDDEDYLNYLVFNHWTNCNCKCVYCFTTDDSIVIKNTGFNILPVIQSLAAQGKLRGGGEIGFGGGEPAVLKEFEPLLNLLLDSGCGNIRVHSSGVKYSPAIERGVREGKVILVISQDSGTRETYKKIKQVDAFDLVWENTAKYAASQTKNKYKVRSKYIICPGLNDNREEIDRWFELNRSAGVNSIVIDVEGVWYARNKNNVPARIYDLFEYMLKRAQNEGMKEVETYDRARHMQLHKNECVSEEHE